jgi:hypothetical protein
MVLCPQCGNKRCPKATWHVHACTGSNAPGQPGSECGDPDAPAPPADRVAAFDDWNEAAGRPWRDAPFHDSGAAFDSELAYLRGEGPDPFTPVPRYARLPGCICSGPPHATHCTYEPDLGAPPGSPTAPMPIVTRDARHNPMPDCDCARCSAAYEELGAEIEARPIVSPRDARRQETSDGDTSIPRPQPTPQGVCADARLSGDRAVLRADLMRSQPEARDEHAAGDSRERPATFDSRRGAGANEKEGRPGHLRPEHIPRRHRLAPGDGGWGVIATLYVERSIPLFWSKVVPEPNTGCWLWTAAVDKDGYGKFQITTEPGRQAYIRAHRFSFLLAHGIEPAGVTRHRCDTASCVNPDHLDEGSQAENIHDCLDRGRHRPGRLFGSKNPRARVTEDDVRAMRAAKLAGESAGAIARRLGLNESSVRAAINGWTWGHLP